MAEPSARELIDLIADPGTFVSWSLDDLGLVDVITDDEQYAHAIDRSRLETGEVESVVVGEADVAGYRVALIFGEFNFLAGSVGRLACQILIAGSQMAARRNLVVLGSPASGGTRMQEGTPSFVLMADVAAAVAAYRSRGLPWVTWLRHPTTGGVMATWGSLGTLTFASPGALVGFLGPRVYEALAGEPFPSGVQLSENLARHGVIDGVAEPFEVRQYVSNVCAITSVPISSAPAIACEAETVELPSPADALRSTSQDGRPGAGRIVDAALTDSVRVNGTGGGERSDAVTVHLGRWSGHPVVAIAQDRYAKDSLGPAALRCARRGFDIAAELNLPLVTIVDTVGAELSPAAEEGALAGEIARCLARMTTMPVPTVALLLGRGCGGGALALLAADRVVAAADAWVAPLPIEGASVIRYRTPDRSEEMARQLRIGTTDLLDCGFVTNVVPSADNELVGSATMAVAQELANLAAMTSEDWEELRRLRFAGGVPW